MCDDIASAKISQVEGNFPKSSYKEIFQKAHIRKLSKKPVNFQADCSEQ